MQCKVHSNHALGSDLSHMSLAPSDCHVFFGRMSVCACRYAHFDAAEEGADKTKEMLDGLFTTSLKYLAEM